MLELTNNPLFWEIISQREGQRNVRPRIIIISPEIINQTLESIPRSAVENLSNRVNKITDRPKLMLMISGRFQSGFLLPADLAKLPPTITGNKVKVQGAKTVRTPAKKAIISKLKAVP